MSIDPAARLVRTPNVIATEVDGELVLMSIEEGRYFGLDAVGSEIWRRLEVPKTIDSLTDELKAHFEGDAATIERDTAAFIDRLSENGLVAGA